MTVFSELLIFETVCYYFVSQLYNILHFLKEKGDLLLCGKRSILFLTTVDNLVWGVPLMVLIMAGGILLTARLGLLQMRRLPLALKWMFKNEEEGDGEISSFAALCTALSATIGTGNIVGVATAVCAGGPGALFWMILAAFFGMATKILRRSSCSKITVW